jgi:hypothetical protein
MKKGENAMKKSLFKVIMAVAMLVALGLVACPNRQSNEDALDANEVIKAFCDEHARLESTYHANIVLDKDGANTDPDCLDFAQQFKQCSQKGLKYTKEWGEKAFACLDKYLSKKIDYVEYMYCKDKINEPKYKEEVKKECGLDL